MAILLSIVLPRYSKNAARTKIITSTKQLGNFFDVARNYSVALNKDILVSFNITNSSLKEVQLLALTPSSDPKLLETLIMEDSIGVTLSVSTARRLLFSPRKPIRLYTESLQVLPSENIKFIFFTDLPISGNILLYYQTGHYQMVEP